MIHARGRVLLVAGILVMGVAAGCGSSDSGKRLFSVAEVMDAFETYGADLSPPTTRREHVSGRGTLMVTTASDVLRKINVYVYSAEIKPDEPHITIFGWGKHKVLEKAERNVFVQYTRPTSGIVDSTLIHLAATPGEGYVP